MAYKTEELEKAALKAIEKHGLFFIEDVVSYMPCSKKTFYDHKLHEIHELKEALLKVKTELKVKMRKKWGDSDNATLQMGLMKLIATDGERKRISQTYTDITTDGSKIKPILTKRKNKKDK